MRGHPWVFSNELREVPKDCSPGDVVDVLAKYGLALEAIGLEPTPEMVAYPRDNPYVFYVGLGTGGVMKTSDNGRTWQKVGEAQDKIFVEWDARDAAGATGRPGSAGVRETAMSRVAVSAVKR